MASTGMGRTYPRAARPRTTAVDRDTMIGGVTPGIEFVRPAGLSDAAPSAYAAVSDPGRTVFTAGACPLDGVRA
jgi:hypothetical protein